LSHTADRDGDTNCNEVPYMQAFMRLPGRHPRKTATQPPRAKPARHRTRLELSQASASAGEQKESSGWRGADTGTFRRAAADTQMPGRARA